MFHPEIEEIIAYAGEQFSEIDRDPLEQHMRSCTECTERVEEYRRLDHLLKQDASFEPPADLVSWAVNLFQPLVRPEARPGMVRRLVAALVYDTFEQPALGGVRSLAVAPARQLLFRAGEIDVDLRIESAGRKDQLRMIGQVLGRSAFLADAPVRLESHGVVRYRSRTNPVGEFSFEDVAKDTYNLTVDLPEGQVTLFCVHREKN